MNASNDPCLSRSGPCAALSLWLAFASLVALGLPSCGSDEETETCADCAQEKCSELIDLCDDDVGCKCVYDCIGASGVPEIDRCLAECDLEERPPGYADLENCVVYSCPDPEECASDNVNPKGGPPESCDYSDATGASVSEGSLPDCSFDSSLPFDPDGSVLQLESADGDVCVRVERRADGDVDNSTVWTLLDMRVGTLGSVSWIEDPADHCWYWSHHNFLDLAHAWTGSRHYDLVVAEPGHGGERYYELRVFEQGPLEADICPLKSECDTPVAEPIALFPVNP